MTTKLCEAFGQVEIHIEPAGEFTQVFGKAVRSRGGSYSECRGSTMKRFVTLGVTPDAVALADQIARRFRVYAAILRGPTTHFIDHLDPSMAHRGGFLLNVKFLESSGRALSDLALDFVGRSIAAGQVRAAAARLQRATSARREAVAALERRRRERVAAAGQDLLGALEQFMTLVRTNPGLLCDGDWALACADGAAAVAKATLPPNLVSSPRESTRTCGQLEDAA